MKKMGPDRDGSLYVRTIAAHAVPPAGPRSSRRSLTNTSTRSTSPISPPPEPRPVTTSTTPARRLLAQKYRRRDRRAEKIRGASSRHSPDNSAANFVPRSDRQIVLNNIRSRLLTLQVIRAWQKDADTYSEHLRQRRLRLMERNSPRPTIASVRSSPAKSRCPALLAEARVNLKNPPRIFTEVAIEQLPGIVSFFQHDVPSAFTDARDPALKSEFAQSNAAVISASRLSRLAQVRPASALQRRLPHRRRHLPEETRYDEMVDIPLDKLLEIGWADLRKNQAPLQAGRRRARSEKDSAASPRRSWANHPAPDQLLDKFRATFDGLVGFIHSHHIVTIPSDVRPILEETPPFMRAITRPAWTRPAPTKPTPPRPTSTSPSPIPNMDARASRRLHARLQRRHHHLAPPSTRPTPATTCSSSGSRRLPAVRKILGANTNVEGWAHYCEQMMLDEGYGQPGVGAKDEREAKLLRLGQLRTRCCATPASSSASRCIPAK